jgi:integrase
MGRFIHLPAFAQQKVLRTQKERWTRLSSKGASLLPYFFKTKPLPIWKGWTQNLERWATKAGLDPVGLGPKSLRKSWESWLVASSPERVLEVFLSQGHTQMTALSHYLGLPFTQGDKGAMLEYVGGWA